MPGHRHIGALGAVLTGLLGAAAAAAQEGPNPVRAQQLRQVQLDAEALARVRERTRALAAQLAAERAQPPAAERSLEGTVQALEGDTLYLRTPGAVVPLKLQASTRLIGHGARRGPGRRPATPAQRLAGTLQEGEAVRARFTVSTKEEGAVNLATSVQAVQPLPAPKPPAAPAPAPQQPPAR